MAVVLFTNQINAQHFSGDDLAKSKEIEATVIELLSKAAGNFEGMRGKEVAKAETYMMYEATATPKMYAQNYYITYANANSRNFYMAYYTTPHAIDLAIASIMGMPEYGGKAWTIKKEVTGEKNINKAFLYYNGTKVGMLREDLEAKALSFSIGYYDNELASLTPVSTTTKAITTANVAGETFSDDDNAKAKDIQAAITDLVSKANSNYISLKGEEYEKSNSSIMYKVLATPKMYAQANYINYFKGNQKNYYIAFYRLAAHDINLIIAAIYGMPIFGGDKWQIKTAQGLDRLADEKHFRNMAFIYYNGAKVGQLRENTRDGDGTPNTFYSLTIGLFDNVGSANNISQFQSVTDSEKKYRLSEHLILEGNNITVKNWGPKFDGVYDISKLATDSCVSGNCNDGHGRKIIAAVTKNIPHIRIMEGKFKNNVFLGDGDMLIDGETVMVDGTYELEKFKVNYSHNSLQAKCVFQPKDYNEVVPGYFSGYLGFGIGKAIDTYEKFVVCKFSADNEDKKRVASKWEKDIVGYDYNLEFYAFWLSKESSDAYAKLKPRETPSYNNTATTPSRSSNSGGTLQKLTIRRSCSACGGTGRIGHNETQTQFTTTNGSAIKTMRMVYQTCSTCHGSGVL